MTLKHPDANTKPGTKLRVLQNAKDSIYIRPEQTVTFDHIRHDGYVQLHEFQSSLARYSRSFFEVIEQKSYVVLVDGQHKSGPYEDHEVAEAAALYYAESFKQNNYEVAELNVVSRIVPAPVITHSIERLD